MTLYIVSVAAYRADRIPETGKRVLDVFGMTLFAVFIALIIATYVFGWNGSF